MTAKSAAENPMQVPNPDLLELAPGTEHQRLEGWIPSMATEAEIFDALDKAFDYRGDVTITLKDGAVINGYIFDRRTGDCLANSSVGVFPADGGDKRVLGYSEIAALAFSGKDRASGASWEAWVKKYQQKKAAGEKEIGLHPENLG